MLKGLWVFLKIGEQLFPVGFLYKPYGTSDGQLAKRFSPGLQAFAFSPGRSCPMFNLQKLIDPLKGGPKVWRLEGCFGFMSKFGVSTGRPLCRESFFIFDAAAAKSQWAFDNHWCCPPPPPPDLTISVSRSYRGSWDARADRSRVRCMNG